MIETIESKKNRQAKTLMDELARAGEILAQAAASGTPATQETLDAFRQAKRNVDEFNSHMNDFLQAKGSAEV